MILERSAAFLGGAVLLCFWLLISYVTKKTHARKILISALIIYMTGVVSVTLFPMIIDPETQTMTELSIRLIPFKTIIDFFENADLNTILLQVLGNILLTIPYGVLIPFLVRHRKWYNYVIYATAFPIAIELTQLAVCVSTNSFYRTTDIDDVILNTLGAVIGYGIYKILPKFIKNYFSNSEN